MLKVCLSILYDVSVSEEAQILVIVVLRVQKYGGHSSMENLILVLLRIFQSGT